MLFILTQRRSKNAAGLDDPAWHEWERRTTAHVTGMRATSPLPQWQDECTALMRGGCPMLGFDFSQRS